MKLESLKSSKFEKLKSCELSNLHYIKGGVNTCTNGSGDVLIAGQKSSDTYHSDTKSTTKGDADCQTIQTNRIISDPILFM